MRPFRALIAHRIPLVMVSTAIYPALDRRPAALSRRVVTGELRGELGFDGVVVTDALDTPALAPVGGHGQVAIRSARAGADLLILAGTYAAGERAAARPGRRRCAPARCRASRPRRRWGACWSFARVWPPSGPPGRLAALGEGSRRG